MGLIRWVEDDHTDTMGYLGKLHICTIEDMFNEHGNKWLVYKAAFPGHLPEFRPDHRFPCQDEKVAREFAVGGLQQWLDTAGLVPKAAVRTEADFRNADIDANGYVTFRDGGAA
ncbi:hypothetical protein GOC43_28805 [Sinorhizobium meliloti]|nr:hypothetical protein [Sinorhizobium meliloti]